MVEDFDSIVQERFQFLVERYGFHLAKIEGMNVTWQKNQYCVSLRYDNYSYELSLVVSVSDPVTPTISFSLEEVLPYVGMVLPYVPFQASDSNRFLCLIEKIASIFSGACKKRNLFSKEAFEAFMNIRKNNCIAYAKENARRYLAEDSDTAWKNKDYKKLVELYEQNADILTEIEKKKYNYAKKHCNHRASCLEKKSDECQK